MDPLWTDLDRPCFSRRCNTRSDWAWCNRCGFRRHRVHNRYHRPCYRRGCFKAWGWVWIVGVIFMAINLLIGIVSLISSPVTGLVTIIVAAIILWYLSNRKSRRISARPEFNFPFFVNCQYLPRDITGACELSFDGVGLISGKQAGNGQLTSET